MTYLDASVKLIQTKDALNLVYFDVSGTEVVMMSLEMDRKLQKGQGVKLGIKPMAIALVKEGCKGSFANYLPARVAAIKEGELLTVVKLEIAGNRCEAIMIRKNMQNLNIQVGDVLFAVFMASELSVQEIYSV